MNEDFLAFIWQHQHFNRTPLQTQDGESIAVHRPGFRNTNAGPDFLDARLVIDGLLWVGAVELHMKTSDWNQHGHANDNAYESVILHVVWENDLDHAYPNTHIPLVALNGYVNPDLVSQFLRIRHSIHDIPCEAQFKNVSILEKSHMVDRALVERLENKSKTITALLERNEGDWNETAWQLLARYFGAKINADAFQKLAEKLPLKLLLRHRQELIQLEALLFGTAGLLPSGRLDGYISELNREYKFLRSKHRLPPNQLEAIEWKLLRLRPAGFPTVRLAQLASLIHREGNLFSLLTSYDTAIEYAESLRSIQSPYWHTHYHFLKEAKTLVPPMGADAISILIINAVVPLLATYGFKTDNRSYVERAIGLLEQSQPERNKITRKWESLGIRLPSAAYSQGATEWYEHYCLLKRCLSCSVGNALLKKTTPRSC
jgi:hypothetical protein